MAPVTTIRFADLVILSNRALYWAEIEGVMYATDGERTWEVREVGAVSSATPTAT